MIRIGFGLVLRKLSACASATALAFLFLASGANISGVAYAQAKDPAACTADCQKEYDTCLHQMGTKEMCGADHQVCRKTCEPK